MARVEKTSRAEADLAQIADFIAADNIDAAVRWADEIDQSLRLLAKNPLLGEDSSRLLLGSRRHTFGRFLIFYRTTADGIIVLRVLHGSRDIDNLRD